MNCLSFKKLALLSISSAVLIATQSVTAHTRLQTPTIDENNARHGSNYNNEVIGHTCKTAAGEALNTIGTVVVFPDGVDSTLTVNGEASSQPLIDFVQNWGSPVQLIQNNDIFESQDEIQTPLGNVVGFWAGGGKGLQHNLTGLIPFRTSGVVIEPTSCARSVTFQIAIADICQVTTDADFSTDALNLWTPAVGSKFQIEDSSGYNSPATLKVNRTIEALPESCGEGVDVVVIPSAAQLNRDMPIVIDGTQIWPAQ